MDIMQFEDKVLSHYSYAIISDSEMILIDPARNPQPYYDLAKDNNAKIIAIIETHPHADFVSSHLEIHNTTSATIYVSKLLDAEYPHTPFDEGDTIQVGKISLKALNTPGHSPDSICIVAYDEEGNEKAVFTGDTLFIGDCGRPDLREKAGALTAKREILAKEMYHSLRDKLMSLPDKVLVYPAHGAGSLCGRGLSEKNTSTMGIEKASNWCLQKMSEEDFVTELLRDQPFVPQYFTYDVALNKKGADNFLESISGIKIENSVPAQLKNYLVIDTRDKNQYKKGFLENSVNLMADGPFETWLGSIIAPHEKFYLIATGKNVLLSLIERAAKIGYEQQIELAFIAKEIEGEKIYNADVDYLRRSLHDFTIMDIRNPSEVNEKKIFDEAINIPLFELRNRVNEIPTDKPIVVHCAAGYRSAAGASIIKNFLNAETEVFDLGEAVNLFKE
jgi:glyoxylase-like metal-dependent hydrolase (beta-lactamase superfamily II)/rhodanese-related sulfurtransferase